MTWPGFMIRHGQASLLNKTCMTLKYNMKFI